ncbi:MAG: tetratricopeptide repeat protein [Pyrinomonadaceae bacterium]
MFGIIRFFVLLALLSIPAICLSGQDLGSSNKLFGGAKPDTVAKPVKKAPVKRKTPVAKTTAPAKKKPISKPAAAKVSKPSAPNSTAAKIKKTDGGGKTSKVEITPSQPRTLDVPVSAASNTLYENLIEDGNNARDDRNYVDAETAYQRARAIKPKDARAIYGLGNIYSDQQRWEDAETAYRTALQLDPRDATAHIALSYVLAQPLSADDLSDRYEEAERLARHAIELAPSNPLAFDQLGVALELRGLISSETENAYRKSIRLDPSFAPSYAHLGRLLRRRGLTRESAAAYDNAIRLSTDVSTMILVAEVMQSEQRYAESERLLRTAINGDPKNPAALLLLGRALTTQGNFVEAEQMLRRGLGVSSNGFMPNILLGSLYIRQGKFEQAETVLRQALRSVPISEKRRLAQQFEAVGDGYLKTGKRTNAARSYRQAMSLDADSQTLAVKIAKTYGG